MPGFRVIKDGAGSAVLTGVRALPMKGLSICLSVGEVFHTPYVAMGPGLQALCDPDSGSFIVQFVTSCNSLLAVSLARTRLFKDSTSPVSLGRLLESSDQDARQ